MLVLVLLLLAANSMQQGPEALPHLHTQFRVQIRTENMGVSSGCTSTAELRCNVSLQRYGGDGTSMGKGGPYDPHRA
jgi:hypothetical protein